MFYACLGLSIVLSMASLLPSEIHEPALNIWAVMFWVIGVIYMSKRARA